MLDIGTYSGEHIRALLVDDEQSDFAMTEALLSKVGDGTIELEWVSTFDDGLEALERNDHDLYLVDYLLDDRDGLELIRAGRRLGLREPIIMLTGRGSRGVDLEAMEAGASDYLVKGKIDPDALERSIRYALERQRAEQALRESEERHRDFFDHLPVGLHRTTLDGRVVDANPALARTLGFPDRETLQNVYASNLYLAPEDRDRFVKRIERDGEVVGLKSEIERFDGEQIRVRASARAVRDDDGKVLYVEGMLEEI